MIGSRNSIYDSAEAPPQALWRHIFGERRNLLQVFTGIRDEEGELQQIQANFFNYPSTVDSAAEWALEKTKEEGREVYFCAHLLTGPRRTKKNAAKISTLYAEKDGGDIPNGQLSPTAVVESSPGHYHCYWRLEEPINPERAERLNQCLASSTGADPSGWDLTQILRVPETVNYKYEDKPLVRLTKIDHDRAYRVEELEQLFPELKDSTEERDPVEQAVSQESTSGETEPPVELGAAALKVYRGEDPKCKEDGKVDTSATLLKIGRILYDAGANKRVVIDALRERDKTLYHKYTDRRDAEKQYAQIFHRLEKEGRNRVYKFPTGNKVNSTHTTNTTNSTHSTHSTHRQGAITAKELLSVEYPSTRWVVPGILPEGVTLLVGKPKKGKSWMALDLCEAIASGGVAFGVKRVDQGDTLYLALEDNHKRLQKRLKKVLSGRDAPDRMHLHVEWPRLAEGGAQELDEWLAEHPETRLVVIDTLTKIRNPARGQSIYQEDYAALEALLPIAAAHGVAIVVVYHLRKAAAADPLDEISSSTGLTAGVDGFMILRRTPGGKGPTLYIDGRDIEEPMEYALHWNVNTATWTIEGEAEEVHRSKERADILLALNRSKEPMTPKEVWEDLPGTKRENIRWLLRSMLDAGEVVAPEKGLYSPAVRTNPAPKATSFKKTSEEPRW